MTTFALPAELVGFQGVLHDLAARWVERGATLVRLVAGPRRRAEDRVSAEWNEQGIILANQPGQRDFAARVKLPVAGPPWLIEVSSPELLDPTNIERELNLAVGLSRRQLELEETTSALIEAHDQLLALYDLAATSSTSLDRVEVFETMADDTLRLVGASGVVIQADTQWFCSGNESIADIVRGEIGSVANERRKVRILRASDHDRLFDVVIHRLSEHGVLAVASTEATRFSTAQLKLIEAIGFHVASMLTLARLHEQALERAVMERDFTVAAALSAQVLPRWTPSIPGVEVAGRCDPARFAAGDFYTYVQTENSLVFATGDVSGKGLPAALVMTMVANAVNSCTLRAPSAHPELLLQLVNETVCDYLSEAGLFVTIALGRWNERANEVTIANAGHSPVLVRYANGDISKVPATAPPIGVLRSLNASSLSYPFAEGDAVIFGSDGLSEQRNLLGEELGYARLSEAVSVWDQASASSLVHYIFSHVEDHGTGMSQDDDRTALVLCRTNQSHIGSGPS